MNGLLEAALQYAEEGLSVFPVEPRGKRPLIKDNLARATSDRDQIREWWEQWPDANIGLVAGDGLAVLDVDKKAGGEATLNRFVKEAAEPSNFTKIIRTGGGGFHFYFRDDPEAPLPQSAGKLGPGLDIRAGGKGYVVAPPSVHPSGKKYELHNGSVMAEVWPWLREKAFESAASSEYKTAVKEGKKIEEGARNDALASLAGRLRRQGIDPSAIEAALLIENSKRCEPPLPDEEVQKIARSVSRYEPEEDYGSRERPEDVFPADEEAAAQLNEFDHPEVAQEPEGVDRDPPEAPAARQHAATGPDGQIHLSDEWAVDKLVPRLKDRVRWMEASGKWLVWRGHKWEVDEELDTEIRIRQTLRRLAIRLREKAEAAPTEAEGKPYKVSASRWQKASGIRGVMGLLPAHLAVRPQDFDTGPDMLNTPGGVVDLRTGELRPTVPGHMFRMSTGVTPREGEPKAWLRFLHQLTGGDQELIDYLQEVGGYCLTGHMYEKTLWTIWGADSDTGKSTYLNVLSEIWGDYQRMVDIEVFINKNPDRIPSELAQVVGVRLVTATEPAAGRTWDEKKVKAITGGDEIQARFFHKDPFSYEPQFKIVVVGNHEPELDTVDDAMLRRIRIIPLNIKVPKERQIPNLAKRLFEKEGPQILNWFIQGCLRWREKHGLDTPEAVQARTEEYAENEDLLGQWLEQCCELGLDYWAPRSELFESWSRWCKQRNEHPGNSRSFKSKMDSRDLPIRNALVGEDRLRGYEGIRLKPREHTIGGM